MLGNMQTEGLLISDIIEFAAQYYPNTEIVSRTVEGPIYRYNYAEAGRRSRQLGNALTKLGVEKGDRIATLAWNTHRHFETYYAVSGMGAVTHTLNPRLFAEQLIYIVNHAKDRYLFVDLTFLPIIEKLADHLPSLEAVIVMTDEAHMPKSTLAERSENFLLCYETLLETESDQFDWPRFDDQSAAALCYTSGTTGNPKGVMYSHHSTLIHAYAACQRAALDICDGNVVLPVVPMFHVCAWGIPYSAPMTGAKIVFPGAGMDGASLTELITGEQVDLLLGVPTVWMGLLEYLSQESIKMDSVERVVIGGSAAPKSMIEAFDKQHDAMVIHAWGMTEMSPLGTAGAPNQYMMSLPEEERYALQTKQGRPVFGVQLKIVDDEGSPVEHDGNAFGRLLVKGPWIVERYYLEEESAVDADGWFDTGDVATIDPHGYMQIVDRQKDVIKSGGEWISSIELENVAVGHPDVQEACVISAAHPKWSERPLLLVVATPESKINKSAVLEYVAGQVAKWWVPDDIVVVAELPHTATGKLLKKDLREEYGDYYLKSEQ